MSAKIPRSRENDYTDEIIAERQRFLEERSGATLNHTKNYSFKPESMEGNCEQLFGVAQVPIGVAGPLVVNGEHAQGEFYVPMATIEGTLIASYNPFLPFQTVAGCRDRVASCRGRGGRAFDCYCWSRDLRAC